MRPKSLVLLLLALGCGLVASIGINQVLASRRAQPSTPRGATEAIFVAIADVDTWEPLTVQNVKLEDWPKERIPTGAVRNLDELDGRRVRTKIYQGEPILEAKLLSPNASKSGATGLIPKGFRAVSVRVDAVSGGSGLILPNDRVDVLVHIKADPARGIGQTVARTILQDVQVFAINEVFRNDEKEAEESAIAAKTITLLVTPQDAELVTLATELGKIRLVMRSPEDDEASTTEGALANDLLNNDAKKGDREDESLMNDTKPASKEDLVDFLNGKQPEPQKEPEPTLAAAEPTGEPKEPLWRMVLLYGSEAHEFEFPTDSMMPREVPSSPEPAPAAPAPAAAAAPATPLPPAVDPSQLDSSLPAADPAALDSLLQDMNNDDN